MEDYNIENNKVALIKIISNTSVYENAVKYLEKGCFKYFDKELCEDAKKALILFCESDEITKVFWCDCERGDDEKGAFVMCKPLYSSVSSVVIENTCESVFLDIKNDFKNGYAGTVISVKLYQQFEQIVNGKQEYEIVRRTYDAIPSEDELHKLAQRNEYCRRQYDLKAPTADGRSEYQRDHDRIIYSKSYRRMVDKTQVFSAIKGDHYRTRMTHTMIVCQIARSICNALGFNQALTESIAIAHDLGHTPFGHVGERCLDEILKKQFPDVGGFKHNYQGLRVVSQLEKGYYEIDGLDLSFQVMEGMLKHTRLKDHITISEFINDDELLGYLHMELNHSVTIEGQIVAVADEIAQRSHDIDDAFASRLLSFEDFLSYLKLSKFDELASEIETIKKRKEDSSNSIITDNSALFSFQISSAIVKYFIKDVIEASKDNIEKYLDDKGEAFDEEHIIKERLIVFSPNGDTICKYLEKMLKNKVLNSNEVSISDQNSSVIVHALFDVYYNNPWLLHTGTKRKILKDFINSKVKINDIVDLVEGSQSAIKKEFKKITGAIALGDKDSAYEYELKRKILVRDICDYIAGMTDTYAKNQYEEICRILFK